MNLANGPVAVTVYYEDSPAAETIVYSSWEEAVRVVEKGQLDGTIEFYEVKPYEAKPYMEPSTCSGNVRKLRKTKIIRI